MSVKTNEHAVCPNCAHPLSRATGLEGPDAIPEDGDYSVCLYCGQLLRFGGGLWGRAASPDEAEENLESAQAAMLLRARAEILRRERLQ